MTSKRRNRGAGNDRDVGYGRPPTETRFQPGSSGNPNGRPRKSRNLKTIIRSALTANVVVREGERKRSVSKLEGIVMRQLESALKGNDKAALATLKMAAQVGLLDANETAMEVPQLTSAERQILTDLLDTKSRQGKRK